MSVWFVYDITSKAAEMALLFLTLHIDKSYIGSYEYNKTIMSTDKLAYRVNKKNYDGFQRGMQTAKNHSAAAFRPPLSVYVYPSIVYWLSYNCCR